MQISSFLAEQNRECYKDEGWFRPYTEALKDLTEDQFNFKSDSRTHSIRELVNHLIFWNERWLLRIRNKEPNEFTGQNEKTFEDNVANQTKDELVGRLFDNFNEWDIELKSCTEEKMQEIVFPKTEYSGKWSSFISSLILHNAYHLGQIMMIRKYFV